MLWLVVVDMKLYLLPYTVITHDKNFGLFVNSYDLSDRLSVQSTHTNMSHTTGAECLRG